MAQVLPIHAKVNPTAIINAKSIIAWSTAMRDLMTRSPRIMTAVDPAVAIVYEYDFYGLLTAIGIDPEYHYAHLLANGYTNPTQYDGIITNIVTLDLAILATYRSAFAR